MYCKEIGNLGIVDEKWYIVGEKHGTGDHQVLSYYSYCFDDNGREWKDQSKWSSIVYTIVISNNNN